MGYVWQLEGFACQLDYILYISSHAWNSAWSFGFLSGDLLFRSTPACSDAHQSIRCQGSSSRTESLRGCICPFHTSSGTTRRFMRSSLWKIQLLLDNMSSVSSSGPAGASGVDSFGLSELTAMQSTQLWPIKTMNALVIPWRSYMSFG